MPVPDYRRSPILMNVLYQSASENSVVSEPDRTLLSVRCTEKAEPELCPLRTLGRNHSYLVRNKLEERPVGGGM